MPRLPHPLFATKSNTASWNFCSVFGRERLSGISARIGAFFYLPQALATQCRNFLASNVILADYGELATLESVGGEVVVFQTNGQCVVAVWANEEGVDVVDVDLCLN